MNKYKNKSMLEATEREGLLPTCGVPRHTLQMIVGLHEQFGWIQYSYSYVMKDFYIKKKTEFTDHPLALDKLI